jgi:hypothetical protein
MRAIFRPADGGGSGSLEKVMVQSLGGKQGSAAAGEHCAAIAAAKSQAEPTRTSPEHELSLLKLKSAVTGIWPSWITSTDEDTGGNLKS